MPSSRKGRTGSSSAKARQLEKNPKLRAKRINGRFIAKLGLEDGQREQQYFWEIKVRVFSYSLPFLQLAIKGSSHSYDPGEPGCVTAGRTRALTHSFMSKKCLNLVVAAWVLPV